MKVRAYVSLTYLTEYWQEENETIEEFCNRVNSGVKLVTTFSHPYGEPNDVEVEFMEN